MWTAAFLRKSWQKLDRLYNVFLAYAEGGLDAVRQLWREIGVFRRPVKPAKPRSLQPSFEILETREVPATSLSAIVRGDDPRNLGLVPIGETSVDLNLGAVRIAQPLDFDKSPGTSMGGNPALVYNSATVGVRPVINVLVTPDVGLGNPVLIRARLTWDGGSPQGWYYYGSWDSTAARVIGVQQDTAVTQTGRYDWTVNVEVDYAGPITHTPSVSGRVTVLVQDSSVSGKIDPYGAGWGIAGVDRLVSVTDGFIWAYGTGDSEFFATNGGGFDSPAGNLGTLTGNATAGYTYLANGRIEEKFDTNGRMTWVKETDNFTRGYSYDSGGPDAGDCRRRQHGDHRLRQHQSSAADDHGARQPNAKRDAIGQQRRRQADAARRCGRQFPDDGLRRHVPPHERHLGSLRHEFDL